MAPTLDTVIYVDIDGVLNVGIRDQGNAPLLLNEENCKMALSYKDTSQFRQRERDCIEKVVSVAKRSLGSGENGTFMDFACVGKQQCSDILVSRLAEIIRAAGEGVSVILASNWRKPKYMSKVVQLEKEVSKHMGHAFSFDGTTEVLNESSATDRLRCIGNHVKDLCSKPEQKGPLRVLLLDDFFVTPFNGWACEGSQMSSAGDVEQYILECAGPAAADRVTARMIHCYDEWRTSEGLTVQVGAGLTVDHVGTVMDFLKPAGLRSAVGAKGCAAEVALAGDRILLHSRSFSARV